MNPQVWFQSDALNNTPLLLSQAALEKRESGHVVTDFPGRVWQAGILGRGGECASLELSSLSSSVWGIFGFPTACRLVAPPFSPCSPRFCTQSTEPQEGDLLKPKPQAQGAALLQSQGTHHASRGRLPTPRLG